MHNKVEIRIIGMQRSGNHPIIDWIASMLPDKSCVLNFVNGPNPLEHHIKKEDILIGLTLNEILTANKEYLVYNYEDETISEIFNKNRNENIIGTSDKKFDVLILRDPYNLFASRIKRGSVKLGHKTTEQQLILRKLWIECANEALNKTNNLTQNKTVILFNKWFVDEDYRKELAEKFGLKYNDKTLNTVSKVGAGSSFNGFNYQNRAKDMKVLERYKELNNEGTYSELLIPEIKELSKKIFGEVI